MPLTALPNANPGFIQWKADEVNSLMCLECHLLSWGFYPETIVRNFSPRELTKWMHSSERGIKAKFT